MLIVHPRGLFQSQGTQKTYSFQGISWHKHRHWVAFIGGLDQVLVHDFEDAGWTTAIGYEFIMSLFKHWNSYVYSSYGHLICW